MLVLQLSKTLRLVTCTPRICSSARTAWPRLPPLRGGPSHDNLTHRFCHAAIRGTKAPPRDTVLAASAEAQAGQHVFEMIGCNICHVESITTAAAGTTIN